MYHVEPSMIQACELQKSFFPFLTYLNEKAVGLSAAGSVMSAGRFVNDTVWMSSPFLREITSITTPF